MADADKVPTGAFSASSLALPPAKPREDMMKELDADCARLKKLAWDMRDIDRRFLDARRDFELSHLSGKTPDLDALLAAHTKFVNQEKDIIALKDEIERKLASWNLGKANQERIYVCHTAEGLPFVVSKAKKTPLWG